MRQSRRILSVLGALAAATVMSATAHASTVSFVFDGALPGPMPVDSPVNATTPCGSPGFDFCDVDGAGLDYSKSGVSFTALGLADSIPSVIIQDIQGLNQGLGVLSEGRFNLDQINFDANESILFTFNEEVTLRNVELNNGTGDDCPIVGSEGGCGVFDLVIDRGLDTETTLSAIVAIAVLQGGWTGTTFEFVAASAGQGFSIAAFDVSMPLPAAFTLFLAGIGGISMVRRKTK